MNQHKFKPDPREKQGHLCCALVDGPKGSDKIECRYREDAILPGGAPMHVFDPAPLERTIAGKFQAALEAKEHGATPEQLVEIIRDGEPPAKGPEFLPMMEVTGLKYDREKTRYDLLPPISLDLVSEVLTYGAKKYEPENWRKAEGWRWRYFSAAMRHLWAWKRGERIDKESGHPHLAHAICCLMFMLDLDVEQR